jgi:hypothetical protein
MKHRAITFAFAVCLVSSLAFADNPTDAPLVRNDESTTVVQQENPAGHNRRHPNKKGESLSPTTKSKDSSKNNRQGGRGNPEYPANANF